MSAERTSSGAGMVPGESPGQRPVGCVHETPAPVEDPCGEAYFDVALRIQFCGRPKGHGGNLHHLYPIEGCEHSDDETCWDCRLEDALWDRADGEREDRAVGL